MKVYIPEWMPMTTRIHIVNFGPDKVEASVESMNVTSAPETIWPGQYKDFYVYDNHNIVVKEIKDSKPT